MRDMQRDFDSVGIRGNLYRFSEKADQYKIFIFVRVRSCSFVWWVIVHIFVCSSLKSPRTLVSYHKPGSSDQTRARNSKDI